MARLHRTGQTSSLHSSFTFFFYFVIHFAANVPVGISVWSILLLLLFSVKNFYYINYIINGKTVLCCKEEIVLDYLTNSALSFKLYPNVCYSAPC